jgi:steroid delta-isomerase
MDGHELLRAHVESFNDAVRSGDFSEMVERFAPDAELSFEGVPVGPFSGKAAIVQAYEQQPPDDTIDLLGSEGHDPVVGRYSWSRDEGAQSGRMLLYERDGLIERLVVTFERE